MTYEEVVIEMTYVYGGENKEVEVKEEKDKYIITVFDSVNDKKLNTFEMDKKTGVITENNKGFTSTSEN